MASNTSSIDFYTAQLHKIDMAKGQQKEPWFLKINPAGRIPALTDTLESGKKIRVFESGSIMQCLVSRYDKHFKISFPSETQEYYEMNSWLFFMNSGVGPMQAQSNHFMRECPEDIPYAQDRHRNETRRLYAVLEKHLKDTGADWLVGNKCTIADLAHWSWIFTAKWADIDIEKFPLLKTWEERMTQRPGVDRGKDVPEPNKFQGDIGRPGDDSKAY